ncbi:hypothetical protein F2Q68_00016858 [Brassica cretica]|uniref:Uncharacterized protein n=1 Tax=Brassica cretica TaxID=69181 RepID=A0A8S9HBU9_BRACR|nr:hypothetical protein F2Q68_00016858 [Brassica cretica]
MVRRKFVGKFRWNTDDCTVNRNVVGSSSVYSDDPCFVGIPSEIADGIPTTSNFWFSSEIELNFHSGSSIYSSQRFACLASHTSRSDSSVTHPSYSFPLSGETDEQE